MLLRKFTIGSVNYFCNELQIKEAGSLEAAAKKMAGIKPEEKLKDQGDKKPIEK
jgi:hypothetical protein